VLDSQRRASQAQLDNLKARYDYIRNLIALKIWSGGLSIDKTEESMSGLIATVRIKAL
jgi:outer membrane protein TolC